MLKFVPMSPKKYNNGGQSPFATGGGLYGTGLGEGGSNYQNYNVNTSTSYNPYTSNLGSGGSGGGSGSGQYNPRAAVVSGVGTAFGGLGGLFGTGKAAQQDQMDLANAAAGDIEAFYDKAMKGGYDYDFTLDPAYAQLYQMSRQKTSTDPLMRTTATGLSALQQGGERALLAGVNPLLTSSAMQETQLGLSDLQREMAGLSQLGQARQQLTTAEEQANQGFARELGMRQLGQAEEAQATAMQNIQDMKIARANAFGSILGGAASAATAGLLGKDGMRVPEKFFLGGIVDSAAGELGKRAIDSIAYTEKGVERRMKKAEQEARIREAGNLGGGGGDGADITITVNKGGQSQTMEYGGLMNHKKKYGNGGNFPDHSGDGEITQKDILMEKGVIPKPKEGEHGMRYMAGGNVLAQIMGAKGGQPPVQGPLPGEASHETNPIDMIDKNGEKVGEAMGGEFIINDKQADLIMEDYKAIENAIADGREPTKDELMDLYESCKQVFGQPQFQDGEAETQMA